MEKILILDNYDSFTYNLVHYVEGILGYEVDVFRNDEIAINDVDRYTTIILSPGPGLPKDAGILLELISTYATTKKILGVCLGMQAIGEVFGGKLRNLESVKHGVSSPISILDDEDPLYLDLPIKMDVGRYHSWVIDQLDFPKELQITAIDAEGDIMSIKHIDYQLYGVQFHPESVLTPQGKVIVSNFLSISTNNN